MSKIGSNIRKIRTVKGLSQSQFAELFNLNRARIGAYEEGRAEPKIDVVIEIAKYFSIPLNDIFVKDLTVNQLTHFNLVQTQSIVGKNDDGDHPQLHYISPAQVINQTLLSQALDNPEELFRFPFPGNSNKGDTWIDLQGVKMKRSGEVPLSAAVVSTQEAAKADELVMAVTDEGIYLGTYVSGKVNVKLTDLLSEEAFELKDVKYCLPVCLKIEKAKSSKTSLLQRITELEARVKKLEKS